MKKHDVVRIGRISEPSYSKEEVEKAGISLHVNNYYFQYSIIIIN